MWVPKCSKIRMFKKIKVLIKKTQKCLNFQNLPSFYIQGGSDKCLCIIIFVNYRVTDVVKLPKNYEPQKHLKKKFMGF